MAVDTRNKRASAIGLVLASRLLMPNPFGTVDAAARLQLTWCYKGIAAAPPGGATYGIFLNSTLNGLGGGGPFFHDRLA